MKLLGVLEVKCPRDRALAEIPDRIPGRYLYQILGQLMCLKDCHRFWYFEYKSDCSFSAWEGRVTDEMKNDCRRQLLQFKDLIDYNTADTFPKRSHKILVDPSAFCLKRCHFQ